MALPVVETPHNVRYLRTKQERMGHSLETRTGTVWLRDG